MKKNAENYMETGHTNVYICMCIQNLSQKLSVEHSDLHMEA